MRLSDVVAAWDEAPLDAIHPTRAVSERAYELSGEQQADQLAQVLPKGATVVDFGCGDGRVAVPLRRYGFKVIGVDASPKMLDALHERDKRIPMVVSDGSDLAEQLGRKVDAVICLAVLIHHDFADGAAIVANLRSILRPGGLLIAHWPTSPEPYERRTWIEVTYWDERRQTDLAQELGLHRIETDLPWSAWSAWKVA